MTEQMGEVRVKVRLTNAGDLEMVNRGLLDSRQVRSREVDAVVDTGATRSVIPSGIAAELGLTTGRQAVVVLADGSEVTVGRTGPLYFEIEGRDVPEDAYVFGDTVLIGQTILELTDLLVDCTNRKVIPNPKHPDGPILRA